MNRLFWKILIALWLTLLAAALGVAFALQMYQRAQRAEQGLDAGPRSRTLLDAAETTLRFGGTPALKAMLGEQRQRGGDDVLAVDAAGYEILGRAVPAPAHALAASAALPGSGNASARQVTAADGSQWLMFVVGGYPLQGPPRASAALVVAGAALASLAFAAALAWYMTRPIRKLQWAFDAASRGKLDTRVQHLMGGRRDEIADLGAGFDQMAQKVQSLMAAQQRLLHDVSHELRSPLARLQAATDLARQSPHKIGAYLDRIDHESARLDQLMGQMLTLSRMEAGVGASEPAAFDLAELLAAVAEDARFEAQSQQRDVVLHAGGALTVVMAEEMIHRAVENVIRNAVKFTAPGSAVEVTLVAAPASARIEVADRGPGAHALDLAAMFEPFHRGANARGIDGHGLGLAIARHAVCRHGGTIEARQRDGGGLVVTIELPRGPGAAA